MGYLFPEYQAGELKFPPFFGQVAKPRFWLKCCPKTREFEDVEKETEAFG
jgi:hypothetical protein